MAVILDVLL